MNGQPAQSDQPARSAQPALLNEAQSAQSALLNEALADIRTELQALRAELGASRAECAPRAPPLAEPEWVWVVLGRDPDEARRVLVVAVVFSAEAASAAASRIRAHERTTKDYPYQLGIRRVRAGTTYLYELDSAPAVELF